MATAARARILVAEDDRNIRLVVTACLEPLGYWVEEAKDGREARERLSAKSFDLLLLDLRMPGTDGLTLLREATSELADVVVLVVSAFASVDNVVECMRLGSIDFLQKPFAPEQLTRAVERALASPTATSPVTYEQHIEQAERAIRRRRFDAAELMVKRAVALDPSRPEAFAVLGQLHEIRGDPLQAQRSYRAALSLRPDYRLARTALDRLVGVAS